MKPWALNVLLALLATMFAVVVGGTAAEIVARKQGLRSWALEPGTAMGPTIVFEPHPVLGWLPKPGTYVVPAYDANGPVRISIQPDHTRYTGSDSDKVPDLVTLGCSFTFGWAVSDEHAFPSRLQQKHPDWRVVNMGVSGYGTYQSLLRLELLLAQGIRPARVVYGYMQGHEHRNNGHPYWMYSLEKYSTQGMVEVPYASLDHQGALVRHAPEAFLALPLRHHLASMAWLELRASTWLARDRIQKQTEITDRAILDMADLCRSHGIDFTVALLLAQPTFKEHIVQLLREHDIPMADCALTLTKDLAVPNDGHPNATAHGMYADCIDRALAGH